MWLVLLARISSADPVADHLAAVESRLRTADLSELTEAQRAHRARLLEVLHAYHLRGVFPHNHVAPDGRPHPVPVEGGYPDAAGRAPVFVDEHDTYCAVATLLAADGREALVREVVAGGNLRYVHEIDDPALVAWAAEAGFTVDELAAVQPSYPGEDADHDNVEDQFDCDDDDRRVYPGADEVCDNEVDDDCDDDVDEDDCVVESGCGGVFLAPWLLALPLRRFRRQA